MQHLKEFCGDESKQFFDSLAHTATGKKQIKNKTVDKQNISMGKKSAKKDEARTGTQKKTMKIIGTKSARKRRS